MQEIQIVYLEDVLVFLPRKAKLFDEYKESTVKTIRNTLSKILQKKFKDLYKIQFDLFCDATFLNARRAQEAVTVESRKKLAALA